MTGTGWLLDQARMQGPAVSAPATSAGESLAAETELLRLVQAGDPEACDRLVRLHLPRAFTVAYRVLGHREDAEDLVQEAFVAALKGIDRFELGRPFAPWLYRIIVNRALSARRARSLRQTDELADRTGSGQPSPLGVTLRTEVRERFLAVLAELPERQRLSVEWHDMDGLTAEEIGALLGISPGTVRWHIHQARQVLREALAPLRGAVEDEHAS